tara:strand:+ start:709 stop:1029 length:321 start_codon:yes stop_codon:yes gene_type:complete
MKRKEIKQDLVTLQNYHNDVKKLHAAFSNEAGLFQSRYRVSGDEEEAELAALYEQVCTQLKVVRDATAPETNMNSILQRRVKALPGLFRRMFPKKQRALQPARSAL